MHVLYLIDSVAVPGGAEQSLALLAPEYRRLGVRLDVAVLHDRPGHQDALRAAGATLWTIAGNGRVGSIKSATELLRERSPDLVHTTLFEADLVGRFAARRARLPVVSSLVTDAYGPAHFADPSLRSWRLRAAWLADAVTSRLAVRLHAVSQSVADTMAKRLRYPRKRIDVVPRGRDLVGLGRRTEPRRDGTRRRLDLEGSTVLLAVARQEHQKGLDIAIRGLPEIQAAIPNAVFVIAGREGAHSRDLNALTQRLGLDSAVRFLGTRADIADLLCAADVFIMPSRREGSPGSLMEAMSLEVPAVASAIPQIREVAGDESVRFVTPDDPGALARAVIATVRDKAATAQQVRNGRERVVAEYSIDRVAERMVTFYEHSLAEAR
jgi:glycosyltransferase involved in cell wall biosynthesis